MDQEALQHQLDLTLWAAFAVAMAFGFIARQSRFCTMGAISDAVHLGDWTRLRMWAMAVGVAMVGFHTLGALAWIDTAQTLYAVSRVRWLSALAGGLLFGLGMVLASGCGAQTLVRIGGGSLKSLVVFCVMGLAAFATLRGVTAVLRVRTLDTVVFEPSQGSDVSHWLAGWLGGALSRTGLAVALIVGGALSLWALRDRDFRTVDNLVGGVGTGLCVVALWWVSGHLGFLPEHPQTLEAAYLGSHSGRMEALSFTAPMANTLDWLLFFSDTAKTLTIGVATVGGVVAGALAQALLGHSFRWEGFHGTRDTALHLVGAALMGVGGVTAMGCSIGQGISGLSTLSITSAIAVVGIVLGALGGLRLQMCLLDRE